MNDQHDISDESKDVRYVLANELGIGIQGSQIDLVRVRSRGRHNILFRARVRDLPYELAAKICMNPRTGARSGASARKQFDQLTRTFQEAQSRNICVIEPVCVSDEKGILVSKWVVGAPLSNFMRNLRYSVDEFTQDCEHAGAWLKAFHSIVLAEPRPLNASMILADLVQTVGGHSLDTGRSPLANQTIALLERTAPAVDGIALPQRLIHGDFHPGNLMKSEGILVGLDTGGARTDDCLRDVVTWMNHIAHMTLMPRVFRLRLHLDKFNAAILHGYQVNGNDNHLIHEDALLWMRAVAALSFLERHRRAGRTIAHDAYFGAAASYNLRLLCTALRRWPS